MPFLLDTCAILFVAGKTRDLSSATLDLVEKASPGGVFVSAISIAEIACLQERSRIKLSDHWRSWWTTLLRHTGWTCLNITGETIAEAYSLYDPIHRDPADRILIATARIDKLTLVTTDARILNYPHVQGIS